MKLVAAVALLLLLPVAVGSAAGAAALAPRGAPGAPLFPWVPVGGFEDHFPYGECTWWAAYNRRVSWNGNAADWLVNARAQGVATANAPSIGAIAVFTPGGAYSELGHVAVVIAVRPTSYTVSEMNAVGHGKLSTRVITWPDPAVQGFIPLRDSDLRHASGTGTRIQ